MRIGACRRRGRFVAGRPSCRVLRFRFHAHLTPKLRPAASRIRVTTRLSRSVVNGLSCAPYDSCVANLRGSTGRSIPARRGLRTALYWTRFRLDFGSGWRETARATACCSRPRACSPSSATDIRRQIDPSRAPVSRAPVRSAPVRSAPVRTDREVPVRGSRASCKRLNVALLAVIRITPNAGRPDGRVSRPEVRLSGQDGSPAANRGQNRAAKRARRSGSFQMLLRVRGAPLAFLSDETESLLELEQVLRSPGV
jgi:hypothetical protein